MNERNKNEPIFTENDFDELRLKVIKKIHKDFDPLRQIAIQVNNVFAEYLKERHVEINSVANKEASTIKREFDDLFD